MVFRYQIKKGAENRIFANARNLGDGIVESDEPLESVYLTPVEEQPATPSTTPQATTPPNTPAVQNTPQQNEQPTNKEGDK